MDTETSQSQMGALIQRITELEQALADNTHKLNIAHAEQIRSTRFREDFLSNMSHELRTPLNAILGLTGALLDQAFGTLNEKQLKALQTVETSGKHLLDLINDILELSKIEVGRFILQPGEVPVESICRYCIQSVHQQASEKHINIALHIDQVPATIYVDQRSLKQILTHLLHNAIKFTSVGQNIGLDVTVEPGQEIIHFTVWDKGMGIATEEMECLFIPFVQIDSGFSRQQKGTGLGLSLVSGLTRLHGGSVTVESIVGEGSRFKISLPFSQCENQDHDVQNNLCPMTLAQCCSDDHPSPLVLLIEEQELFTKQLTEYLSNCGYQVVVAHDGIEALDYICACQPVLIVIDMQIHGVIAKHIIQRIRKSACLLTTPIIALTSLVLPGDKERCLEIGVSQYMARPINLKELVDTIESLVHQGT